AQPFASLEDLFKSQISNRINAMIVCTPPSAREEYVQAALSKNLAVLVEKPLAHTLAAACRLSNLSSDHPDTPTAVGYCHRFTPAIIEIKNRITNGTLGEIVRFENTFASNNPKMQTHWMSDPAI